MIITKNYMQIPNQNIRTNIFSDDIHPDLLLAQKFVYGPLGLVCKNIRKEKESDEYGAFQFELNNKHIVFRVAKITPKKIGQFVTLWKRDGNGPIVPFDVSDKADLFVVSVRDGEHFGQFIFPKSVLCNQGVISKEGRGGKRAIRVYPPWVETQNMQARKSQKWQGEYFTEISSNSIKNVERIQRLFS